MVIGEPRGRDNVTPLSANSAIYCRLVLILTKGSQAPESGFKKSTGYKRDFYFVLQTVVILLHLLTAGGGALHPRGSVPLVLATPILPE